MVASFMGALDWLGIVVFAVTGALVASRKQMDVVGFAFLATVTGVGGGTARDLMLGTLPVFWVKSPGYVGVCIVVAVVVFFTAHIPQSRYRLLLWLDATGLSFFCIVGAQRTLETGAGAYVAIIMGVITATLGGVIRDILGAEVPVILRREIYATAALAGTAVYVGLSAFALPSFIAATAGFLACFAVRGLALHFGWSLPPYRARAGRDPSEIGL